MRTPVAAIEEAVRRIVAEVRPVRIVVFGSAARGDVGPDSDLDILVVMPDGTERLETTYRAHRSLRGVQCAVDIVVVTEAEVAALKDNPSLVVHTALTEGKEVYHAA